jgi:drug/metabolite transporter (DMT)-like permease
MNVAPREDRLGLAVGILAISFFLFATMDTIAKVLVMSGLPGIQVASMRFFWHAVVTLAFFLPQFGLSVLKSAAPRLQVLRALGLLGSTIFNFIAVGYLPLTVTISIFFASPLLMSLLAIPMLGETVGIRRLMGIAVGFLGVLVITQPWSAEFHPAMFLSLAAMCCASFYFIMTRKIAGTDNNPVSQIYGSVIPTLAIAPFGFALWVTPDFWWQWALLVLIGVLGFVGHAILTVAYRYAEASRVAPVVYTQILYATIYSWLIFSAMPTGSTALGTVIIVASGIYIWARERALQKKATALSVSR